MNVDKFGHYLHKRKKIHDNSVLLKYMSDESLNADNKIIKNLRSPIDDADGATKAYVDESIANSFRAIKLLEQLVTEINIKLKSVETQLKK